ncbi:protein of unknown function [Candidatus Nitrosocosmicus franklandus]|uniref:Uncharacterized protein n=1 Tax=Candidatus Nitrosocosmicus franklandianus TaxID=1798806 RepID=A0A484I7D6_9ARCH|nr:protein of unknown function [Candidatus Nitrosocosmicus franklandus]
MNRFNVYRQNLANFYNFGKLIESKITPMDYLINQVCLNQDNVSKNQIISNIPFSPS